jgi:long-chain acyl-CoA synthetase
MTGCGRAGETTAPKETAMHISEWAARTPDAPAIIMAGTGERVTFAELEAAANRGAQLLRRHGLTRGDSFALWSGNNPRFLETVWAMQRSGLYLTPVQAKLKPPEAAYVIDDCNARLLIIDAGIGPGAEELARRVRELCPKVETVYALRGDIPGVPRWEAATAAMPAALIDDPSTGQVMIYSSGTTGRPKGVRMPLSNDAWNAAGAYAPFHKQMYGTEPGTVFLATAPLYHTGPLNFVLGEQRLGATTVVFEKFDAEAVLAAIQDYKVERAQFVPTMFTRMLKLPAGVRARYDHSNFKVAIHSAAPCPVDAKKQMIDWWGPILIEVYGGTEGAGATYINSHEWLKKPGSVGRSVDGRIHICSEAGEDLPLGETGVIYFEGGAKNFSYFNDPEKTKGVGHPIHPDWATFGDIGRIDEDGYLFLSDRRAFMIIAGGVNIYPQEAENLLVMHPEVTDVAVFGVPDPDMGEQVKAVVQPVDWSRAGQQFEAELIAYCRANLATLKCPKTIDFERELPRDPTGKMMKRELRARYWETAGPAATV